MSGWARTRTRHCAHFCCRVFCWMDGCCFPLVSLALSSCQCVCVCMYVCFEFDRSWYMQKIIMWLARATNILISFLLYSHTHCPDLYSLWYLAVWCSIILILSLQFKHTHTYIRTQNVPFFFVDFLLNRYSVLIHSPKHNIIDRNYFTVSNENENCFPKK